METDEYVGFMTISAEDIDDIGIAEVIKRIRDRVGTNPVYLTSVLSILVSHMHTDLVHSPCNADTGSILM